MSDLSVPFEKLEETHSTCVSLKSQFDDLPHRSTDVDWGDGSVSGAMEEFGGNWDYHRKVLSDKIKQVGEKVESCITTFQKTDTKVYQSLVKNSEGGGK